MKTPHITTSLIPYPFTTTILVAILFAITLLSACTSGDSASSSGGAGFTNVSGTWNGSLTQAKTDGFADLTLTIVFPSSGIINGVASFTNNRSTCLISGPLDGIATNGQVSFKLENNKNEIIFSGTASSATMAGTFVIAQIADAAEGEEDCAGVSGSWSVLRK